MKLVKRFLIAFLEAFSSTLNIKPVEQVEVLNFDVLASKTIEQVELESHESLNTIIEDYNMTMFVKHMFMCLFSFLSLFGVFLTINNYDYRGTIAALLLAFACYKLYTNRKHISKAKRSFIQFIISNEVECEKAKKIPGYQMRDPGIYEDNLS